MYNLQNTDDLKNYIKSHTSIKKKKKKKQAKRFLKVNNCIARTCYNVPFMARAERKDTSIIITSHAP